MSKNEFVINIKGVNELRKSPEMNSLCSRLAETVVAQSGEGFEKHLYVGQRRLAYTITPNSKEASMKNLKENTLVKALGAAKI